MNIHMGKHPHPRGAITYLQVLPGDFVVLLVDLLRQLIAGVRRRRSQIRFEHQIHGFEVERGGLIAEIWLIGDGGGE